MMEIRDLMAATGQMEVLYGLHGRVGSAESCLLNIIGCVAWFCICCNPSIIMWRMYRNRNVLVTKKKRTVILTFLALVMAESLMALSSEIKTDQVIRLIWLANENGLLY